jgi:hypothetical protein
MQQRLPRPSKGVSNLPATAPSTIGSPKPLSRTWWLVATRIWAEYWAASHAISRKVRVETAKPSVTVQLPGTRGLPLFLSGGQ